jgi:hypothetical protein
MARALTRSLLEAATSGEDKTVLQSLATERKPYIERLIREDTEGFFEVAISDGVRGELLGGVSDIEESEKIDGHFSVVEADGGEGDVRDFWIEREDGAYTQVYGTDDDKLMSLFNAEVEVMGYALGGIMATDSQDEDNFKVVAVAPAVDAMSVKKWAIIMVGFTGESAASTFTENNAANMAKTVNDWMKEVSFGKFGLSGVKNDNADIYGTYITSFQIGDCDYRGLQNVAFDLAKADGFEGSGYNYVSIWFPQQAKCNWGGLGEMPGKVTWINTYYSDGIRVIPHELGHNFGLRHANAEICRNYDGRVDAFGKECDKAVEYADVFGEMGSNTRIGAVFKNSGAVAFPHFGAVNKEFLGWIPESNVRTVTESGTYDIYPLETVGGGVQLLKIWGGFTEGNAVYGKRVEYVFDFRQTHGFDSYSSGSYPVSGVMMRELPILYANGLPYRRGWQEMTVLRPISVVNGVNVPVILPGQSVTNKELGFKITVLEVANGRARVQIDMEVDNSGGGDGEPVAVCERAAANVSIRPDKQAVRYGETARYTVAIKNNDGEACGSSKYKITSVLSDNWDRQYSPDEFTVGAGKTYETEVSLLIQKSVTLNKSGYVDVRIRNVSAGVDYSAKGTFDILEDLVVGGVVLKVSGIGVLEDNLGPNDRRTIRAVASQENGKIERIYLRMFWKTAAGKTYYETVKECKINAAEGSCEWGLVMNDWKDAKGLGEIQVYADAVDGSKGTVIGRYVVFK